ncbi:PREDICTED: nucleolin-like [Populus euphratica]|uniref:Nucleolin-like n=1 Tax=Populus euphratica TaxID=75702 RepID=A0AAJ6Y5G7_POPEU|nr:PREDICTED: nucleolin-like [Populus euphratica]
MKATKAAATKKTPAGRKPAAAKAAPDSATEETPVPKTLGYAKQTQNNDMTPLPTTGSDSKLEQSPVEGNNIHMDVSMATLDTTKPLPIKKKVVRRVVKVVKKTPANAKVLSEQTPKTVIASKSRVEESSKEEELAAENVGESLKKEEVRMKVENSKVESVAVSVKEEEGVEEPVLDSSKDDGAISDLVWDSVTKKQTAVEELMKVSRNGEPDNGGKGVDVKEDERKAMDDEVKPTNEAVKMEETLKDEVRREEAQPEQDEYGGDDGYEEYGDRVDFEDPGEDDFEDPDEPAEEADAMEDERRELTAVAKERKIKKEYEIFVGGLDRDATEEDLRKVFETIGEVVEVRLHKNLSTNRNKGYAFVKFASKEHVKRALSEMKNPVIRGKRCGTAPSEDNDTLFLGNICNTWTKEAIRQKLKDYGVEGVENITVVSDAQHEGRSRGFAFLEFACHADAMLAYKRLQKPDVVFGHPERTAKVAFSEPIREPDPEIMAQVKTIFLDGLPPHWDEDRVRECLKGYGEIVRVVLARNMSTAKRKDFGFVDFSTHDAAVACIEGINNREFGNGNTKTRVKARLSNPLPKTQAVKGGMCGGFRIGHSGSGNFTRFGRGFGRGGHHSNWANFQRGRGFYQRGRGQTSRMVPHEYDYNDRYDMLHGRQGGRRGTFRGGYHTAGRGMTAGPSRSNMNRAWHDIPERGHRDHVSSRRQPFSPEETFDRRFVGRHFDDPYFYDDGPHGMKRPFYMTDQDPDYMEPSRLRPRLDYSDPRLDYADPAASFRGTHYRDAYGAGSEPYFHEYRGSDYASYPPYYGSDHSYGGGYRY